MLQQARVNVIDLTNVQSQDSANHSKFATGEVVTAIGDRLAGGQALSDAKPGLVESLGTFTKGAVNVATDVTVGAVTAPIRLTDPTAHEKSVDTAEQSVTLEK